MEQLEHRIVLHGDALERANAEFISQQMPNYGRVWASFFGNDGTNHLIAIEGVGEELEVKRKKVSQYTYTCLESIICLRHFAKKYLKGEYAIPMSASSEYLQFLSDFMAIHAHMGRIHDQVKEITSEFPLEGFVNPFKAIYEERHAIVHGHRMPFAVANGEVLFPEIENSDDRRKWYDTKHWDQLQPAYFVSLSDQLTQKVTMATSELNLFFGKIYAKMKTEFGNLRVMFPTDRLATLHTEVGMYSDPANPSGVHSIATNENQSGHA